MLPPEQQEALYEEGRLDLARQAYKQGQFETSTTAALAYDIRPKKLKRRLDGIQPRRGSRATNRLLTPTENETLVQWILLMDRHGMPPRPQAVEQIATLLLCQHHGAATMGKNWASRF